MTAVGHTGGGRATGNPGGDPDKGRPRRARRVAVSLAVVAGMGLGFAAVAVQLVRLAIAGQGAEIGLQMSQPVVATYSRPDIVDRNGNLLATDLEAYSLFADPQSLLDADEASEALAGLFPELDRRQLREQFADKSRRFVWIKRGLPAAVAQQVHNLGLPGLAFRTEPKRNYPLGRLAGHLIGSVTVDNKGLSGIERHIDSAIGLEPELSGEAMRPPVALTVDIGVQHGMEEELALAVARFSARGAAAVLLDVDDGQVLAAASLPDVDPATPAEQMEPERLDRLQVATYELGSVFKTVTIAMALEYGLVTPGSVIDVRGALQAGAFVISDPHPAGRPLTVQEIFVRSSNVGAGRLALMAGAARQRAFLERLGLTGPMVSEIGSATPPQLPAHWGQAATVTVSYGHGIAVAPLQFAAAAAALVNGGHRIEPRFVRAAPGVRPATVEAPRVVSAKTSAMIRDMLRRNVISPNGTGRSAAVAGFDVGGKTGTAEMAAAGGYRGKSVVSSFLAVFPIAKPRYLLLVTLVEPKPAAGTQGQQIAAGTNAAPVAGRIIHRVGALLPLYRR